MREVKLDITNDNLIDFHHVMPVIETGKPFRFVVENWDSDDITELKFSDFRPNSTRLNPWYPKWDQPVTFDEPTNPANPGEWSVKKTNNGEHKSQQITVAAPTNDEIDRRIIDYTLTMKMQDGTCVSIDPPLDERRPS